MRPGVEPFLSIALSVVCLGLAAASGAETLVDSDFDSGFGVWSNVGGDDFNWSRASLSTPSLFTGPDGDHTPGLGGYYVYTNATFPNSPYKTALLEGPCLDLTGKRDTVWTFWYHMYGLEMGTLYAEVAAGCGTSWTPVFSISGNQGTSWHEANIDLGSYDGTSIAIRFRGVTGSGYTSDMAVDDVLVEATPGIACTENWECDDGVACTDDVCGVSGYCEPSTDNCPGDQNCDLGSGACVPYILSEDFSGTGGPLNGTMTEVGGLTWQAGPAFLDDGTVETIVASEPDGNAAFVPFAVETGEVYVATVTITNPYPDWVAFGFMPALPPNGDWTETDYSVRHSNNGAYAWVLTRDEPSLNDQEGYNGPDTGNPAFAGDLADPQAPVTYRIELDTTAATWVVEYFLNDVSQGSFSLDSSAPSSIGGIGFSRSWNATAGTSGSISEFTVQTRGVCGDGTQDFGEQCDDGNTADGDCCSSTCQYEPPSTVCRAAAGACDVEETCDGAGSCPADAFEPATTECREPAGLCDLTEMCTGTGPQCPADAYEPPTTVCRPAIGICDAEEVCDGVSPDCPADYVQPSGTVCRASSGECDAEEVCDGVSTVCPMDGFLPIVCRPAIGPCDVDEVCGASPNCPADAYAPAGTECREAAGVCDAPDYCDGASPVCPPDAKLTGECRGPAGVCDVAEVCDGVSDHCPADQVLDGVPCPDGDLCNGDEMCVVGVCTNGTPPDCGDQDACTDDSCDAIQGCVNDPIPSCEIPVPSASPAGRVLLGLLVFAVGAAYLGQRRRFSG